jgi:hypothetical protein
MKQLLNRVFGRSPEEMEQRSVLKAWDRELARATSPSQRAEIDAIFARHS